MELQNSNEDEQSITKSNNADDDWVQKLPSDHSDEFDEIEANNEVAVL